MPHISGICTMSGFPVMKARHHAESMPKWTKPT